MNKIDEIKDIIEEIAKEDDCHPNNINMTRFNKYLNDNDKSDLITYNDLKKEGGLTNILNTYYPLDKNDEEIQNQKKLRSYIRKLEKDRGELLSFHKTIKNAIENSFEPIKYNPYRKAPAKRTKKTEENVLMLNDTHIGAIVKPEEVGGLNEFDFTQASRRIAEVVSQACDYRLDYRNRCKRIHLLLNGDLIAGIIHDLESKQIHLATHQVAGAIHIFVHVIAHLIKAYDEVYVHGITGNHERAIWKSGGKRVMTEHYDSFANMIFYALSVAYRDENKVKFFFPPTPYAFIDLPGGRAMMAHGHATFSWPLKGSSSRLNIKGLSDSIQEFSHLEEKKGNPRIDLALFGHVHFMNYFITKYNTHVLIANALLGVDGYAHSFPINDQRASQTIFHSDPDTIFKEPRFVDVTGVDENESLDAIIPVYDKKLSWR